MQNVIVGTAGHVDHGKTCLIKALTGTDTDRLKEEQKRGITIELGFANLPNDEGIKIGIIDVPGHEKFVKNMLAGIGGIDLVLLVIALEEGVMPQTTEHFEILKMLHIKEGIIVFTKADLVDDDWAELVNDDVDRLVKGSFLEKAERIKVSAFTGLNIDKLKEMVIQKVKSAGMRRQNEELFRLPIDRVFTMEGFGTVVTGTLLEGCCHVGQEVMVYPEEKPVKIRGLQVHGQKVETAYAGQRTAINLVNAKKEDLTRGEVLAATNSLIKSRLVDAKIQLFSKTERQLKNGDRVHINYGSAQTICKVMMIDKNLVKAKDEAYVQLRFDEPICVKRNDRFIIRFYSPVETFGGGIVLDAEAIKHKRLQENVIEAFRIKELGTDIETLEQILLEESGAFPMSIAVASKLNWTQTQTLENLEKLIKSKKVLRMADGSFIHKKYYEAIIEFGNKLLSRFHTDNPILDGMDKEEFKSRILEHFRIADPKKGDMLLNEMVKRGVTTVTASSIAAAGFTTSYSNEQEDMRRDICARYEAAGYEVPSTDEVCVDYSDKKQAKQIINDLAKKGELVKINFTIFMHKTHWDKAIEVLKECAKAKNQFSLGEYRDMLGTSRKYAVLILEHCDAQKITKKSGDTRTLIIKV